MKAKSCLLFNPTELDVSARVQNIEERADEHYSGEAVGTNNLRLFVELRRAERQVNVCTRG